MEVDIKGIKTYYELSGEGKNVLLLHGWGASLETFRPVINFLSRNFRVIALDFPGCGKTPEPDSVWGVTEYAEFVEAFIHALNIEDPALIGHSHGGRVILSLVGNQRVKASKIILVDSAGIKPKRKLKYHVKVVLFKSMKRLLRILLGEKALPWIERARKRFGSEDYKNAVGIMRDIMVKLVNEDLRHLLPGISVPTLLIWGGKDTATPLNDGKIMEKMIPDAGLVVFKEAGHYAYLDRIGDFNVIVQHFLGEEKTKHE